MANRSLARINDITSVIAALWAGRAIFTLVDRFIRAAHTYRVIRVRRAQSGTSVAIPYTVDLVTSSDTSDPTNGWVSIDRLGVVSGDGSNRLVLVNWSKFNDKHTAVVLIRRLLDAVKTGKLDTLEFWT